MGVSAASCRRAFRISAKRFILPFASLTTERLRRCYNPSRDRLPPAVRAQHEPRLAYKLVSRVCSPVATGSLPRKNHRFFRDSLKSHLMRFFNARYLYPRGTSIPPERKVCRRRRLCRTGLPCFWCSVCFRFPCGLCRPGEPGA